MQKFAFAVAAVAMAGAATTFTTSPALAGVNHSAQTVSIDTRAYDLDTEQGYSLLTDRIDRASKQVCGAVDVQDLAGSYEVRACQDAAVSDAMAQLIDIARSPTVTVGASR